QIRRQKKAPSAARLRGRRVPLKSGNAGDEVRVFPAAGNALGIGGRIAAASRLGTATFDVLADLQVFDRNVGFLVFHAGSPGFLVWLWLAPNNKRAPPVTALRGIRSSNRMQVVFLPPGWLATEGLPTLLVFWGTP